MSPRYGRADEETEMVEIPDVMCRRETAKAILVIFGEERIEKWIPKSLLADESEVRKDDDHGVLTIPAWFAEKEGFV